MDEPGSHHQRKNKYSGKQSSIFSGQKIKTHGKVKLKHRCQSFVFRSLEKIFHTCPLLSANLLPFNKKLEVMKFVDNFVFPYYSLYVVKLRQINRSLIL